MTKEGNPSPPHPWLSWRLHASCLSPPLPPQDRKEKLLCKLRERHGLIDQINLDLTYAVCFNLANCYHQNGMRKEVGVIIRDLFLAMTYFSSPPEGVRDFLITCGNPEIFPSLPVAISQRLLHLTPCSITKSFNMGVGNLSSWAETRKQPNLG